MSQKLEVITPPPKIQTHEKTVARGLRMDDYVSGRRVLLLEIDELRVVKRKMGFFRLGFLKVARLEGVRMSWYQNSSGGGEINSRGENPSPDPEISGRLLTQLKKLKQYLPVSIKGVEFINVKINFFQDKTFWSSIAADKAKVGLKGQRIVFKGGVRIVSNSGKILNCEELTWLTSKNRFVTSRSYVLKKDQQQVKGSGLDTDFALTDIVLEGRKNR